MADWQHQEYLPPELADVAEQLRAERPAATPLELDRIKLRAKKQASRGRTTFPSLKGSPMRSRALTLLLSALLVGGTTVGGIAAAGGGGNGNSASSQYKPGMGCGDKNHVHTGPPGNPSKNPATDCPPGSAQNP
jgi:hypothetical protein